MYFFFFQDMWTSQKKSLLLNKTSCMLSEENASKDTEGLVKANSNLEAESLK